MDSLKLGGESSIYSAWEDDSRVKNQQAIRSPHVSQQISSSTPFSTESDLLILEKIAKLGTCQTNSSGCCSVV